MKINYKNFDSSDYEVVLSSFIEYKLFPDISGFILITLQNAKYTRLKKLWNKKIDEYLKKYGKYKGKNLPKTLMLEHSRSVKSIETLKKKCILQQEIVNKLNIAEEQAKQI